MWYIVLTCVLSVTTLVSAKQTYTDLPSDVVGLLTEKSVGCIAETGADFNILQRVFQWQFDDNDTSKKFSYCLFKNSGLSDEAGAFDVDQVLDLYRNSNKRDEVAQVARECNKIQDSNHFNRMYQGLQCFIKNTPVLLQVNFN